jgi:glycosyltransferase involved in cell wall biosynthesis
VLGFLNPLVLVNIYQLRLVKSRRQHVILVNGTAVANHGTTLAVAFYGWFYGIRCSMYIPMLHTAQELGFNFIKSKFYDASIGRSLNLMSDIWTIDNVWSDRVLTESRSIKTYVIRNFVEPLCKNKKQIINFGQCIDLCFVGRVEKRQKGLDYLIDILENIETNKEILMHIVGDGTDLEWLKNETLNGKFRSKIRFKFHGWVSTPLQILSNCDALIISSRVEGVPLVAIESLMVGTPVFAFAIPGIIGLVSDDFIKKPFSIEEFSKKLNSFLFDQRSASKVSRNIIELTDLSRFEIELNCAINGENPSSISHLRRKSF